MSEEEEGEVTRHRDSADYVPCGSASPILSATRCPTIAASPGRWRGAATTSTCSRRASRSRSCRRRTATASTTCSSRAAPGCCAATRAPGCGSSPRASSTCPSARRMTKEIARLDPDVLHVQWLGLPRYDLRWLEAVGRERPVVFTAHDVLPRRTADKVDLWRRVFNTVDRVVVHGAGAVEQLAELGVDRARIVRIPHPVFEPAREIAPPQGPTLVFFGLIRRSKGLDLLISALPAIAEDVPDVRLIVAGDPIEPAEPFQELARELECRRADRVASALSRRRRDRRRHGGGGRRRASLPPHRIVGRAGDRARLRPAGGGDGRRFARRHGPRARRRRGRPAGGSRSARRGVRAPAATPNRHRHDARR